MIVNIANFECIRHVSVITLVNRIVTNATIIICVPYLVIHGDVNIEDVALHQGPAVGHPMCRHVIHRARDTFGETLERKK